MVHSKLSGSSGPPSGAYSGAAGWRPLPWPPGWPWSCPSSPIRPDLGPLEREGAWIADRVEAYRAAHGVYPPDLDAAGATPRTDRYGGWQYEVSADGTGFGLQIGRYAEDGFILYRGDRGGWYADT